MLRTIEKSERQQRDEAEIGGFREALGPFVTAAEATRMPMMFTDAKLSSHPVIFVNQAFLDLTGFEEHEVMGQNFDTLIDQGTRPDILTEIETAFGGGRDLTPAVRYLCRDDKYIWVTIYIAPVRDAAGGIVQYFASFVDETHQKDEETRLLAEISRLHRRINELTGAAPER